MDNIDRELLELAAKAAGLGTLVFANGADDDGYDDGIWKYTWHRGVSEKLVEWNPLINDGDALRLAVKLNILKNAYLESWIAHEVGKGLDWYAATRRAIVRIAAEIGRNMK